MEGGEHSSVELTVSVKVPCQECGGRGYVETVTEGGRITRDTSSNASCYRHGCHPRGHAPLAVPSATGKSPSVALLPRVVIGQRRGWLRRAAQTVATLAPRRLAGTLLRPRPPSNPAIACRRWLLLKAWRRCRVWAQRSAGVNGDAADRRCVVPTGLSQAVASVFWLRWSLSRLWVAVISRHSDLQADLPRRKKRSMRRLNLVFANTGSIVSWRLP